MSFNAYRATAFNYTHENKAFDRLYDSLKAEWSGRDEPLHLLGNFYVDGCEIDALIIKRDAIIVIDFKDYGGSLSFSENGRWRIDDDEVRGGNKTNPYQQIRDNKFQLLNYLKPCDFRSGPNLGHITGLCLFHQSIHFNENQLPHNVSRWFHITDMEKVVRITNAIVSSAINLPISDIELILDTLDVPAYLPDNVSIEVPFDQLDNDKDSDVQLNEEQAKAVLGIEEWLGSKDKKVFSLAGAYSTGKSKVLKTAVQKIILNGKSPIYLAPNARISNLYKELGFADTQSIYSWLYAGKPSDIKNGKASYPISLDPVDSEKEVLVFLDSHLLGDEHFETDTTIYGSGSILQDLLSTLLDREEGDDSSQSSRPLKLLPKFLLIGDPYQLTRGARERSLLRCQIFEQRNIHFKYWELNSQDRKKESPIERLDFQKTLIEQLKAEKFTQLPICEQGQIRTIQKGEQTDSIADGLRSWPRESVYLCATNDIAHSVNIAIRKKYLKANNPSLLVIGDIVDLHNRTPKLGVDQFDGDETEWINAGTFGRVVSVNDETVTKSKTLKGRDKPEVVTFAFAEIDFGSAVIEVCYLPDFLGAKRPELTSDQTIALLIWAREEVDAQLAEEKAALDKLKSVDKEKHKIALVLFKEKYNFLLLYNPLYNSARLRFAYSLTVHRAQGYAQLPKVILDGHRAHDTDNPATDSYFRWLYTASVCTSSMLHILDYPILTPLSKTQWSSSSTKIAPVIFKSMLYYYHNRKPTDDELAAPLPSGFSKAEPSLVALLLAINDLISGSPWHVDEVIQHNYKERYLFSCDDGKVELDLNYNGKYEFSLGASKVIGGLPELANQVKELLSTEMIYGDPNVEMAVKLFGSFISRKEWFIISVDEKNYKAFVIAENNVGRVKVELNVPSDASVSKKGVISSIKVQQADSTEILSSFKKDFSI